MYKATPADIKCFRDWLSKVPYLPQDYDDFVIQWIIEGNKGRMERAKTKFDNMHKVRALYPDIMANIDVNEPEMRNTLTNQSDTYASEVLSKAGSLVVYNRLCKFDPSMTAIRNYFKSIQFYLFKVLLDKQFMEPILASWSGSLCIVVDMENWTVSHSMLIATLMKPAFELIFTLPLGIQAIHYVNATPAFATFVDIAKSIMSKKIGERVFSHREGKSSLIEFIGKEALPADYGGDGPTLKELSKKDVEWFKKNRDRFVEFEAKLAAREKLRPKTEDSADLIVGTFRQLQVD